MSNHEYWNELGNLYFMHGAYQPAIHAYLRSIELDGGFGKSYGNLAMALVHIGKYPEAIKLYRHSIRLLPNEKEQAIAWNKLGILYRQVKEYNRALEAYQQADLLDPHMDAETKAHAPHTPLTVAQPALNIDTLIASLPDEDPAVAEDSQDINGLLELAEEEAKVDWYNGEFVPPNPEKFFNTGSSLHETMAGIQSEWRLAYTDEITSTETPAEEAQKTAFEIPDQLEMIVPIDLDVARETISETEAPHLQADAAHATSSLTHTAEAVETQAEVAEYSLTEYPLMELSDAEKLILESDIAKYKSATQNNPRSYQAWQMLGDAYKAAGLYKDAIKAFQTAISINSTKPAYYYRLGLVYSAERREAEAVAAFQRVLELDPNYAQAHASLATQYQKMGLNDLAQEHIDKATQTPFEEETEYNLACWEAIRGNNDRALELLEVALQAKQADLNWAQKDPDLEALHQDQRFHALLSAYAVSE
ncbi:MAG: tetratricopeptide repeat protein [Anaerolineales bacterium]|nr:tetratricopeptide repeat protein [Anaerolineales bacterium]